MQITPQSHSTHEAYGVTSKTAINPDSKVHSTVNQHKNSASMDLVTISVQAAELLAQSIATGETTTLPAKPSFPYGGDKVENYLEFRKAKTQYQIYSDIAGFATGNSKGMSASTVYYLSNNDDARATVVNRKAHQQQVSAMQTYAKMAQMINE